MKKIVNCHTHIFTLSHVPDNFGKTIVPNFVTITRLKKIYDWFEKNNYRFIKVKSIFMKLGHKVEVFPVIGPVFQVLKAIIEWILKIIADFFQINSLLTPVSKKLLKRYINLIRYASYKPGRDKEYGGQDFILKSLISYYPEGTRFVILPMDMEFMEAGKVADSYSNQLTQLVHLKRSKRYGNSILPFAFVDPRRIQQDHKHIDRIIELVEKENFSGLKMYPALGYYPFDKSLIPIYEYAKEKELPIMTHCIKGSVYYRGKKKEEWNKHPILTYSDGSFVDLPEIKNIDFSNNFTHPLNYECLLNPDLLNKYLGKPDSERIDLSSLKICLAHFGGEDQWYKYLEDGWSDFGKKNILSQDGKILGIKDVEQAWRSISWLPLICGLISKYKNVYADISYILHDDKLLPILNALLSNESKFRERILFGTDYYVTSSQATEKDVLSRLRFNLSEDMFDLIAHDNPAKYLKLRI